MSTLRVRRIFTFNGSRLADPSPAADLTTVKAMLSAQLPELANATITLKETKEENNVKTEFYEFVKKVGIKG
jgi:PRTRC genetic system protein C